MKTYPYIGKDNYGQVYLMLSGSYALTMDGYSFTHTPMEEGGYKNITHEYLQNTYGEVQSPEHAEFIIELAKANNIEVCKSFRGGLFFNFYSRKGSGKLVLFFFHEDKAKEEGEKLITIPLPPKQIQTATPEQEFEMKQIMKNAGDNLVLGYEQDFKVAREIINELREDFKCNDKAKEKQLYGVKEAQDNAVKASSAIKTLSLLDYTYHGAEYWEPPVVNRNEPTRDEWPQVGDEVLVYPNSRRNMEIRDKVVKVIGKCLHSDGSTIITVEHSSLGVFAVAKESCIKPKTPEEELRDEIKQEVFSSFAIMPELLAKRDVVIEVSERIANNLVKKYITKKPQ